MLFRICAVSQIHIIRISANLRLEWHGQPFHFKPINLNLWKSIGDCLVEAVAFSCSSSCPLKLPGVTAVPCSQTGKGSAFKYSKNIRKERRNKEMRLCKEIYSIFFQSASHQKDCQTKENHQMLLTKASIKYSLNICIES